ncbi:uncharacterized protein LOC6044164 isoform X1 [Culex quinquefasciatus]|uniref:uncharacterized protein LOC6044164 isoform X1 n=1 Tax=Culex quinquefasciatus TaxID=7176 RepID=UPI0018E29F36|nr:uncharacterized protein LOC6044164 isoform X1 [Culex quinquefasciatus]XP_038120991.1 uncharacterized protein LOC6044164 isoform X1 [Culex quinquefasciatus]XP_038120992.1 uncharacterized protein LOC6044164 isoform X1 [Culex quinquefasciatus]XP_039431805.1 uncharacterized protein LOC120414640 isoform X1 [Culex pipiens pallens]XP_039431806.1 uncharacterized protein LOC120414640 isoform X1 [Culex pipiens pallens]XP_039431807.1 uncharacterized protein LOC120414640 isoform X1 [Culex pipiens palle
MPGATTRPRRRSSLTAVIFLITVGLGAKVGDAVDGTGTSKEEVQQVSPSQRYFDAVAPEDRENFIKYHLDKALEERYTDYVSRTQADFSFVNYGEPTPDRIASTPTPTTPPAWSSSNNLPSVVRLMFDTADHRSDVYINYVKYSLVCYSSGCIDPADIGNICCPF